MIGSRMYARRHAAFFAGALLATLVGCSGGGGGSGSGGSGSTPTTPSLSNFTAITVDAGPPGLNYLESNVPFVSVTVCSPGSTSNCQTIDHIAVDTGSTGLRLISSVVSSSLSLPIQRNAQGTPIAECLGFADGSLIWGSVRIADVRLGGEQAASVPIQLIGDSAFPTIPTGCSGVPTNTVQSFGANGILGVSQFREDCGTYCAQIASNGQYYACSASGCSGTAVAQAQQVVHPVALFGSDNNGVLISLPAVPASGAATVSGSLIFGIGTQSNNGLGVATVLGTDPVYGYLTTAYGGRTYPDSVIDSGSSALFLPSSVNITVCPPADPIAPGFLCPSSTQNLSATISGTNGKTSTVSFSVANAHALLNNSQFTAFSNIAAPNPDSRSFDWGLPFFYGRNVFTAIENATTPGGAGPYVAY